MAGRPYRSGRRAPLGDATPVLRLATRVTLLLVLVGLVWVLASPRGMQAVLGWRAGGPGSGPTDKRPPFVAAPSGQASPRSAPAAANLAGMAVVALAPASQLEGESAEGPGPATPASQPEGESAEGPGPATPVEVPKVDMRLMALVRDTDQKEPLPGPYYHLLDVALRTPPRLLEQQALKDWLYEDVFNQPADYRGKVFKVRGHFRQIVPFKPSRNELGLTRLWQAVIFSDRDSYPYLFVVTEVPRGMPTGDRIYVNGWATGFFLRIHPYRAEDGWRGIPMLMGRSLGWEEPVEASGSAGLQLVIVGVLAAMGVGLGVTIGLARRADRRFAQLRQADRSPPEAAEQLRALAVPAEERPAEASVSKPEDQA